MDRWVPEYCVRVDDEVVEELLETWKDSEDKKKMEKESTSFLSHDEHHMMTEEEVKNFMKATKLKTVEFIQYGEETIETWYHSDLPVEYHCKTLFVCPFCMYFFTRKKEYELHSERCMIRCPPGDEIYRDEKVSVFEFDAKQQKVYTENLCYIAKLFLDHKNISFEIDAFYFYILCERREDGYYMVGYFSKEKESDLNYNLSCIMVLPHKQRFGYGKFIIDFSYQLSLIEKKQGSPEKPLSFFGHRAYVSYWCNRILNLLLTEDASHLSIQMIAEKTGILPVDIEYVLTSFEILRSNGNRFFMYIEPEYIKKILSLKGRPFREVKAENIHWVPHYTVN